VTGPCVLSNVTVQGGALGEVGHLVSSSWKLGPFDGGIDIQAGGSSIRHSSRSPRRSVHRRSTRDQLARGVKTGPRQRDRPRSR